MTHLPTGRGGVLRHRTQFAAGVDVGLDESTLREPNESSDSCVTEQRTPG